MSVLLELLKTFRDRWNDEKRNNKENILTGDGG
jgi:hypothetical protein